MNKPNFQVDPDSYHLHIWRTPGASDRIIHYDTLDRIVWEYGLDIDNPNLASIEVEDALNNLPGRSEYVLMTSFKEVENDKT